MLLKMGWKPGQGLGRRGQGPMCALDVKKRQGGLGIGAAPTAGGVCGAGTSRSSQPSSAAEPRPQAAHQGEELGEGWDGEKVTHAWRAAEFAAAGSASARPDAAAAPAKPAGITSPVQIEPAALQGKLLALHRGGVAVAPPPISDTPVAVLNLL
jgi:hypothetical protein